MEPIENDNNTHYLQNQASNETMNQAQAQNHQLVEIHTCESVANPIAVIWCTVYEDSSGKSIKYGFNWYPSTDDIYGQLQLIAVDLLSGMLEFSQNPSSYRLFTQNGELINLDMPVPSTSVEYVRLLPVKDQDLKDIPIYEPTLDPAFVESLQKAADEQYMADFLKNYETNRQQDNQLTLDKSQSNVPAQDHLAITKIKSAVVDAATTVTRDKTGCFTVTITVNNEIYTLRVMKDSFNDNIRSCYKLPTTYEIYRWLHESPGLFVSVTYRSLTARSWEGLKLAESIASNPPKRYCVPPNYFVQYLSSNSKYSNDLALVMYMDEPTCVWVFPNVDDSMNPEILIDVVTAIRTKVTFP